MGMTPSYIVHDGFLLPKSFPCENFASALEYLAEPGDVFVSAYPKCGTTWTQNIVHLLLHDGVPLGAGDKLTELFPHLEEVGRQFVESLAPPRCIKTHLPFAMTPYHADARYIYVARNPFDCAVSFFHHTRGFPKHYDFAAGTFPDFFECFLAGEVDFGDYFDNLTSWYARRNDDNVLFLTYEAMKRDARASIAEIGTFLGVAPAVNSRLLESVLEHSRFDSMRKKQGRWSSRRPEGMPTFIRRGVVGDWSNHFTAAHAGRLLEKFRNRARGTDLESLWPDILDQARVFQKERSIHGYGNADRT